jgi:hypothetical protein
MKRIHLFIFVLLFTGAVSAQIGDKLTQLPPDEVAKYALPLATASGTYFNSGGYFKANVSKDFGFKFSIIGMQIYIPEEQQTFSVHPYDGYSGNETSATFFGEKGAAIAGSNGYIIYPPGVNLSSVPAGIPQIAVSYFGVEAMLRYFPKMHISDTDLNLWGVGLKYNFTQLIPDFPVDIAAQFLFNNFEAIHPNAEIKASNIAFNIHASKTFELLIVYGGIQYEQTSMDLNYTFDGLGFPGITPEDKVAITMEGENKMRYTLGVAFQVAVFALNVDYNIGNQNVLVAGLNFEF